MAFFSDIEAGNTAITILQSGEYISHLGRFEIHTFEIEIYERKERWEIIFFGTAIPHARIQMSDREPPLKKDFLISIEYTKLFIKNSLADIAEGFDDNPKPFFQKLLNFTPENWFAIAGKLWWVYLRLKMLAIPQLDNQFLGKLNPKLPLFDFGNYLSQKVFFNHEEIVMISMNKKCFKSFLQSSDSLILGTLSREEITEWLNYLNLEFDVWFSAIVAGSNAKK